MEADFLRVAQTYELDAAMDRALSILCATARCAALPCCIALSILPMTGAF